MQGKLQAIISTNFEELNIGNENVKIIVSNHLREIVEEYNGAFSKNPQASCLISNLEVNDEYSIKAISNKNITELKVSNFVDEKEIGVVIEKRNSRLFFVQMVVICSAITVSVLEIIRHTVLK